METDRDTAADRDTGTDADIGKDNEISAISTISQIQTTIESANFCINVYCVKEITAKKRNLPNYIFADKKLSCR
jgi:hypothetical protein